MKWQSITVLAFLLLASKNAHAEKIQFDCGTLSGPGVYSETSIANPNGSDLEWIEKDRINGQFVINIDTEGKQHSYTYKDSTNAWYTPEEEGAFLIRTALNYEPFAVGFLTVYPQGAVESFVFTNLNIESRKVDVIKTSTKSNILLSSATLMAGKCTVNALQ